MNRVNRQSGAVSLFMVVIAMLLMTVVTVSFLRVMTQDQMLASSNDLSQSAYDSAEAGVEDAKRALVWYVGCQSGTGSNCAAADSLDSSECNAAIRASNGTSSETGEVKVQQSTAVSESGQSVDAALDQAYTCVTIEMDTEDYIANIDPDQSVLVPLVGTGDFDTVTIEWYNEDNLANKNAPVRPASSSSSPMPLLTQEAWPENRPSVLRTQFMQVGSSFTLADFDYTTTDSKSNANTLFLYPALSTAGGMSSAVLADRDARANDADSATAANAGSAPLPTTCEANFSNSNYACKITLTLPTPVGATDRVGATAYLRLTSMYVGAQVRITLDQAGSPVLFNDVQPIVDSTGRASDLFRRVQSRIDLYDASTFPYPEGAVDVAESFCKNFGVTDTAYIAGSCTP